LKLDIFDWLAIILVIIGALNWGLVGLLGCDLVVLIFGSNTLITRVVYGLVGLAGAYIIYLLTKLKRA